LTHLTGELTTYVTVSATILACRMARETYATASGSLKKMSSIHAWRRKRARKTPSPRPIGNSSRNLGFFNKIRRESKVKIKTAPQKAGRGQCIQAKKYYEIFR
jgi:hypothetical protein